MTTMTFGVVLDLFVVPTFGVEARPELGPTCVRPDLHGVARPPSATTSICSDFYSAARLGDDRDLHDAAQPVLRPRPPRRGPTCVAAPTYARVPDLRCGPDLREGARPRR